MCAGVIDWRLRDDRRIVSSSPRGNRNGKRSPKPTTPRWNNVGKATANRSAHSVPRTETVREEPVVPVTRLRTVPSRGTLAEGRQSVIENIYSPRGERRASLVLVQDHEEAVKVWKSERSISTSQQSNASSLAHNDGCLSQSVPLSTPLNYALACADGVLKARMRVIESRLLLRWSFTCFKLAARTSLHVAQLKTVEERLKQVEADAELRVSQAEDELRRREQRIVVQEERVIQSEENRRREKARFCKLEMDNRRLVEWRRNYEARCPAATRSVAVAILSASQKGYNQGVGTLVFFAWSSHMQRMHRARLWKLSPGDSFLLQRNAPDNPESCDLQNEASMACSDTVDAQVKASDTVSHNLWPAPETASTSVPVGLRREPNCCMLESPCVVSSSETTLPQSIGKSQTANCVWVESEATEQLSEAIANMRAWKLRQVSSPRHAASSPSMQVGSPLSARTDAVHVTVSA